MERFDTELGRFYRDSDGLEYVGVTTALEVAVSKSLKNYFQTKSANYQAKRLQQSGDMGTRLHDLIQSDLRQENPIITDPTELKVMEHWYKIRDEEKISCKPAEIEVRVKSKLFGFAGTLDMIGEHKGIRCIIDLKTGSYSVKAGWQMALYRLAWHEMTGEMLPIVGINVRQSGEEEAKSFVYQHFDFTERMGLCCLEVFKGLYFTKLKAMDWPWLTKNSLKTWLETYYPQTLIKQYEGK